MKDRASGPPGPRLPWPQVAGVGAKRATPEMVGKNLPLTESSEDSCSNWSLLCRLVLTDTADREASDAALAGVRQEIAQTAGSQPRSSCKPSETSPAKEEA